MKLNKCLRTGFQKKKNHTQHSIIEMQEGSFKIDLNKNDN